MKYIRQFLVILSFSLLGEVLHALLPFPVPASIYGLVGLFTALISGLIKTAQIRDTSTFLTGMLPLLFVSPVVSLLDCWDRITPALLPILIVIVASTLITFGISGRITQWLLGRRRKVADHD